MADRGKRCPATAVVGNPTRRNLFTFVRKPPGSARSDRGSRMSIILTSRHHRRRPPASREDSPRAVECTARRLAAVVGRSDSNDQAEATARRRSLNLSNVREYSSLAFDLTLPSPSLPTSSNLFPRFLRAFSPLCPDGPLGTFLAKAVCPTLSTLSVRS